MQPEGLHILGSILNNLNQFNWFLLTLSRMGIPAMKSVRFQSGQEKMERHSKWEDIPYAQERLSPKIMKKNETHQRISSPKKKKVTPSRHRYSNSDVILAPTLMRFDPDTVESRSHIFRFLKLL